MTVYVFAAVSAANFEPNQMEEEIATSLANCHRHTDTHTHTLTVPLSRSLYLSPSLSLLLRTVVGCLTPLARGVGNKSSGDGDSMLHAAHRVIYASIITIYIHSHTYTYTYRYRYIHTACVHIVCGLLLLVFNSISRQLHSSRFPSQTPQWLPFPLPLPLPLPACSNLCFLVVVTERNCHARACQCTSWRREESIAVQLTIIREEEFPLLIVVLF